MFQRPVPLRISFSFPSNVTIIVSVAIPRVQQETQNRKLQNVRQTAPVKALSYSSETVICLDRYCLPVPLDLKVRSYHRVQKSIVNRSEFHKVWRLKLKWMSMSSSVLTEQRFVFCFFGSFWLSVVSSDSCWRQPRRLEDGEVNLLYSLLSEVFHGCPFVPGSKQAKS